MKTLPVLAGLLLVLLLLPVVVLADDTNTTATSETTVAATTTETTVAATTTTATTETTTEVTTDTTTETTTEVTTEVTTETTSAYGSIYAESDPEGAAVYLNSSYEGVTPITLSDITPGYYELLLTLDGYCDSVYTIGVVANDETDIYDTMISVNGTLYFSSYPSGASIFLDSVYQGVTPLTLYDVTAGTYTVLLQLSGYDDMSGSYTVTAGNQTSVYNSFTSSVTEETTVPTTIATSKTTTKTTTAKSSVTVPTAWPTDTTPASPVGILTIISGVGLGMLVLRKP